MRRIFSGLSFIILGMGLIVYPLIQKETFDSRQDRLIKAFEEMGKYESSSHASNVQSGNSRLAKSDINSVNGAIGTIIITKINLKMLIFKGSNSEALNKGIGMIEPKKKLGVQNIGLAGHRSTIFGKQFNRLNELAPGDEIEIRTKSKVYTFVVNHTFVVPRTQIEVLADKKTPYVTLVTCTPIGKKNPLDRLIVQAKLTKQSIY